MSTKLVFHLQYVPKICTLKMISVDSITNTPGQSVQSSLLKLEVKLPGATSLVLTLSKNDEIYFG